jgi:hypothetical protein
VEIQPHHDMLRLAAAGKLPANVEGDSAVVMLALIAGWFRAHEARGQPAGIRSRLSLKEAE